MRDGDFTGFFFLAFAFLHVFYVLLLRIRFFSWMILLHNFARIQGIFSVFVWFFGEGMAFTFPCLSDEERRRNSRIREKVGKPANCIVVCLGDCL